MPSSKVSPRDEAELNDDDAPGVQDREKKTDAPQAREEEEDLADHYIRTVHWTRQTMLSTQQAIKSVWKRLVQVRGPQEAKEALKSYWTTLGVVSALLLSVSYTAAITPITSEDPDKQTACTFVTIIQGLSLMISLLVIVVTVIYIIEIDNCTTEKDLQDFIFNNGSLFDALSGVFSASVVFLAMGALGTMYITYTMMEFLVVAIATAVLGCMCAAFAAVIAGHNRFRLWARYDSPLARARGVPDLSTKQLHNVKSTAVAGGAQQRVKRVM